MTTAQHEMAIAMAARDLVRSLAARKSGYEYELHKMADRLDAIAKEIGMTALTLVAAKAA
jgi:hypothetical protein